MASDAIWPIIALLPMFMSNSTPAAVDPGVRQQLAKARVPFVANEGHWDPQAAFVASTFAGSVFVTTAGKLIYSLPGKPIAKDADEAAFGALLHEHRRATARTQGWVLTETFVGADQQPVPATLRGYRPAAAKVTYFSGNNEHRHQRRLDTYERVGLGEVFPGIHVQLRATGNNVEKLFTVDPRRDPRQIRLEIGGATRLELGGQGELMAHTGNGPILYTAPIAYQEDEQGNRRPVAVRYALDARTNQYGFAVADYDTTLEAALSDVILLGTEEQIRLASKAANDMVAGRTVETAEFVVLRAFIREVLDLDAISADILVPRQGPARPSATGGRGRGDSRDAAGARAGSARGRSGSGGMGGADGAGGLGGPGIGAHDAGADDASHAS